jgi:medium-chain acyl-[acyl-carrier-protein] hydrolase
MPNRWFPYRQPRRNPAIRLFCFSHAGAGAALYRQWDEHLPVSIEVCAVQLPGRETRFREPLCRDMTRLLDSLEPEILPLLNRPFALFGYSAGALMVYALALRLSERTGLAPLHLFTAACAAPQFVDRLYLNSTLPDLEFEQRIRALNGFVSELAANAELFALTRLIVRADLQIIESHKVINDTRVSCPISVFAGSHDWQTPTELLRGWAAVTRGSFQLDTLDGDHFFIRNNLASITRKVSQRLTGRVVEMVDD